MNPTFSLRIAPYYHQVFIPIKYLSRPVTLLRQLPIRSRSNISSLSTHKRTDRFPSRLLQLARLKAMDRTPERNMVTNTTTTPPKSRTEILDELQAAMDVRAVQRAELAQMCAYKEEHFDLVLDNLIAGLKTTREEGNELMARMTELGDLIKSGGAAYFRSREIDVSPIHDPNVRTDGANSVTLVDAMMWMADLHDLVSKLTATDKSVATYKDQITATSEGQTKYINQLGEKSVEMGQTNLKIDSLQEMLAACD